MEWQDIETAPKDGTEVLVYAPPYGGLGDIIRKASWHEEAGWRVDEFRSVTHWQPLTPNPNGLERVER